MHRYDHVIVDGYNLLHAVDSAARHLRKGKAGLADARGALIRLLSGARRPSGPHITVVFDATRAPKGVPGDETVLGVEVVYAPRSSDADTVIRGMIDDTDRPRRTLVVSSDREVVDYARLCGVGRIRSGEFATKLGDRRRPRRRRPRDEGEDIDPPVDVADWAEWMGLDVDE